MDGKLAVTASAVAAAASAGMMGVTPADAAGPVVGPGGMLSGFLELNAGFGSTTDTYLGVQKFHSNFTQLGAAGRLNWWVANTVSVQVDAWGSGVHKLGFKTPSSAIGGHVALHTMGDLALAAFGSFGRYGTAPNETRLSNFGFEAMLHGMNWSIMGQVGVVSPLSYTGPSEQYGAVEARWFLNKNLAASIDATMAQVSNNTTYTRLGIGIEHKLGSAPLSIFGRAQWQYQTTSNVPFNQSDVKVSGGVRLYLNQGSLWSNNIDGATWKDMNHWFGWMADKFAL
jgi:hypothetical protein